MHTPQMATEGDIYQAARQITKADRTRVKLTFGASCTTAFAKNLEGG